MLGWLKRTLASDKPKTTAQTVEEVMSAYRDLLVKYPIAIMDVSKLPIPKKQMKLLLKAVYAKATRFRPEGVHRNGSQIR
jgi:hypothetical protein